MVAELKIMYGFTTSSLEKIGLTTQHIRRIKIAKEKIALQYNPKRNLPYLTIITNKNKMIEENAIPIILEKSSV